VNGRATAGAFVHELRLDVRPRWCFRLPRYSTLDGLTRSRDGVLHRLLHVGETSVYVRVVQTGRERVLFCAQSDDREAAAVGLVRMRDALGIDQDLAAFHRRFRFDPLIGRSVRADPSLRVRARPEPFEALTWAICEQLIEYERAAAIERRIVARFGRRCERSGLRDAPTPAALAAQAPVKALDLSGGRARALIRTAREVDRGRIDLHDPDHERGWRRLRAIPGIGAWTVQSLALGGQGRLDQLPFGDLAYRRLVGRQLTGDPWARAEEAEVEEFFAPYAPWAGLAGAYALRGLAAVTPARPVAA
jgi:DNA-3-methyladenine glycosylase II